MQQKPQLSIQYVEMMQQIALVMQSVSQNTKDVRAVFDQLPLEMITIGAKFLGWWESCMWDLEIKQKLASLMNSLIIHKFEKIRFEVEMGILVNFFYNFDVGYDVKKIMMNSLTYIAQHWHQELNGLFEQIAQLTLGIMDKILQKGLLTLNQQFYSQPLIHPLIPQPIIIKIKNPQNFWQIYQTIILIADALTAKFSQDTIQADQTHILMRWIDIILHLSSHLFNQSLISTTMSTSLPIYDRIIQIWNTWMNLKFQRDSLLVQCVIKAINMHVNHYFQIIYRLDSQPRAPNMFMQPIYNYVQSKQQKLLNLKAKTAQLHSLLLNFVYCYGLGNKITNFETHSLKKSILFTLQQSLKIYDQLSINQKNCLQKILIVFSKIQDINPHKSERSKLETINTVLLPYIIQETGALGFFFEEQIQKFMQILEDSCDQRCFDSPLTTVACCLEKYAPNQNIMAYLFQLIKRTFPATFHDDFPIIKAETSIMGIQQTKNYVFNRLSGMLLLNLLLQQYIENQPFIQWLRETFTETALNTLDTCQCAYLYNIMGYCWKDIYQYDYYKGQFYFQKLFQPNLHPSLQSCILDFIENNIIHHLPQAFPSLFLAKFQQIQSQDNSWAILQQMIKRHIKQFTQEDLYKILGGIFQLIKPQFQPEIENKNIDRSKIFKYFQLCRSVAKSKKNMNQNGELCNALYQLGQHLQKFQKLQIDDQVVFLLAQLVASNQQVHPKIQQIWPLIQQTLRSCQFSGAPYYALISNCIQLKQKPISFDQKIRQQLLQAVSYGAYYPDQLLDAHKENTCGYMVLLQSHLILTPEVYREEHLKDIKDSMQKLTAKISMECKQMQDMALFGRILNLNIIVESYLGLRFDHSLVDSWIDKGRVNKTQARTLAHLLSWIWNKTQDENTHYNIMNTFLNLIRSESKQKKNQIKGTKYDLIYSYHLYPFPIFKYSIAEVITQIREKNENEFSFIFARFSKKDYQDMQKYLIQKTKQKSPFQYGFEDTPEMQNNLKDTEPTSQDFYKKTQHRLSNQFRRTFEDMSGHQNNEDDIFDTRRRQKIGVDSQQNKRQRILSRKKQRKQSPQI